MNQPAAWHDPPPPLRGLELNTWTHHSIVDRLPETGQRVLAENDFPLQITEKIQGLIAEIPDVKLKQIKDPASPDNEAWQNYLLPHLDSTWLEVPWFLIETYFYRRLIAITGYFERGLEAWRDPFAYQKRAALKKLAAKFNPPLDKQSLSAQWLSTLWGNQADLSLWPEAGERVDRPTPKPAQERILVDQRRQIGRYLQEIAGELNRIDLILDNAGQELLSDLALASQLQVHFPQISIHLHAKTHPTFVSDATPKDILETLKSLAKFGTHDGKRLAEKVENGVEAGAIQIHSHLYWTSPLAGWEMPNGLASDLAQSQLLIFKGDANYRRLLGDRHWPLATPFADVVGYLPSACLTLRTLKSEIAVGLDDEKAKLAELQDSDWIINGNWGLIQFFNSGN